MGKAPAFQFYVKDWLCDPQLRQSSAKTRGMWIDFLCYMWEAPSRGELTGTKESLGKMIGAMNGEMDSFLADAMTYAFCDISVTDNGIVQIRNRRMWREEKDRNNNKIRQQRHREKMACNADITPPSSSSSSSSCTKVHNKAQKRPLVLLPDWLEKDLWQDFKEHRNKLRKPMTSRAEETVIKKLTWLKEQGHNPRHCLLTAIERGWLSVFEPKE